ncbi:FkbM family methyltransferase [Chloroflexota bacterium]
MTSRKYPYYLASIWKLLTEMQPRLYILGKFLGMPAEGEQVIELSKSGIRFKIRGVMDIWTIKETFLDRFYEKFGTPIGDGWTVVDIGAGIGDFSILAGVRHPKNKVFAFEPSRDSYTLLLKNLELNQVKNVRVYPEAIWSHSTELAIDTSANEPGQYKSRPIGEVESLSEELVVPSLSLEEAFERSGLTHCDLLKIDCEGAEFVILCNTPDAVLQRIERIVLEYHDDVEGYNHKDLVAYLASKGFDVNTYPNYVHPYLGYLYAAR